MPPTVEDIVTYTDLVGLGRERARREWLRSGKRLEHCKPVAEMCAHPSPLSRLELSMLAWAYRDELHAQNAHAEARAAELLRGAAQ